MIVSSATRALAASVTATEPRTRSGPTWWRGDAVKSPSPSGSIAEAIASVELADGAVAGRSVEVAASRRWRGSSISMNAAELGSGPKGREVDLSWPSTPPGSGPG